MNLTHTVGDIRNFVNACAPISTDLKQDSTGLIAIAQVTS